MSTDTRTAPSRQHVWQMFDRIAHRYDFLNHTLSLGIDYHWRRQLAEKLPARADLKLLDLATGTADVLIELCQQNSGIQSALGLDLSEQMLAKGREKIQALPLKSRAELKHGDACQIPVEDSAYDVITMAFGIRNVLDVDLCLREMLRVLAPGGRALILEFSLPPQPLMRSSYLLYLRHILPQIGGLISGDGAAYRYLNQTIESFPCGQDLCDHLIAAGFKDVAFTPLSLGIASIYQGDKPF
ncbi:MAG: bifunctional demethylmenaquinone methyltransferase/2-methoxy-6-polyprenyl-1,4-benzoquinol methylase UbiE [Candidatus Sericytochromatia bacterium]